VLRVADQFAGRQAKCPGCATAVLVPANSVPDPVAAYQPPAISAPRPAAPPPLPPPSGDPFAFDDRQGTPARGYGNYDMGGPANVDPSEVSGWKAVRSGLRLFQIALMIFIGAVVTRVLLVVVAFLGAMSLASSGSLSSGDSFLMLVNVCDAVITLAMLGSQVVALVGLVLALPVPASSGCKPFIVTALSCIGGGIFCMLLVVATQLLAQADDFGSSARGASAGTLLFGLLGLACWITATVMMLIFLNKTGRLLQSDALCKQVTRFAVAWGVGAGVMIVSFCGVILTIGMGIAGGMRGRSDGMVMVLMAAFLGLVMVVAFLVVLVMYLNIIVLARDVIARKALNSANA
jgi:hypothetical protein